MKLFQFLVAAILLVSYTVQAQEPPDPTPGATKPVREQNLDADGWIAVHEQGTVEVQNAIDQFGEIPLLVQVDEQAGKQPVLWACGNIVPTDSVITGCTVGGTPWAVPEGKRLVIEMISVKLDIDSTIISWVDIRTMVDGSRHSLEIPMQYVGVKANGWSSYVALENVKLYADYEGGQFHTPMIIVRKEDQTLGAYVTGAISGYLIDY